MKPSIAYMKTVCLRRYEAFGTAGNGSKIEQMTLDDYAAKYAKGELAASTKKTVAV